MTLYARTVLWENVAVVLKLNTNISVGKDKPYAMVIAFDEEYINLIFGQKRYF